MPLQNVGPLLDVPALGTTRSAARCAAGGVVSMGCGVSARLCPDCRERVETVVRLFEARYAASLRNIRGVPHVVRDGKLVPRDEVVHELLRDTYCAPKGRA